MVPGGVVEDVGDDEVVCVRELGGGIEEREVADEPLSISQRVRRRHTLGGFGRGFNPTDKTRHDNSSHPARTSS